MQKSALSCESSERLNFECSESTRSMAISRVYRESRIRQFELCTYFWYVPFKFQNSTAPQIQVESSRVRQLRKLVLNKLRSTARTLYEYTCLAVIGLPAMKSMSNASHSFRVGASLKRFPFYKCSDHVAPSTDVEVERMHSYSYEYSTAGMRFFELFEVLYVLNVLNV